MLNLSPEVLYDLYAVQEKSDYEIASVLGTYPNAIRRARYKAGIASRDHSKAQANAIKQGRHKHPTKGNCRSDEVKQKISETLKRKNAA